MDADQRGCAAVDAAGPCTAVADDDSGMNLCAHHLLAAYDWTSRQVGITDLLPSPCLACGSRLGVRYPSGWLCAICEWRVGDLPDGEATPVRVDVVYYLRYRDRVKIGTSSNPRGRLAQLKFDELMAFERGNRVTEQRRHRQFAPLRLGGEWFQLDDELLDHIRHVAAGVEDPWGLHRRWVSEQIALRE